MDEQIIEQATQALVTHSRIPKYDGNGQTCAGCNHLDGEPDGPNSPRHMAHVARAVLEAVAPAIAAQALRDAGREALQRGDIGCPDDDCPTVWDWLCLKADRIEKEES